MATITTYRALVQNEVGDVSSRAQNVIDRALADTYQEILYHAAKYLIAPSEEDIVATASQRYVDTSVTYSDIRVVLWHDASDTDFKMLAPITEEDYYRRYVNRDASTPAYYYVKANRIYFDVAPDSAGTCKVSGIAVQDELEGDEVSVIPDRFTRVIILGAIARFKAYEGTPDASEYQKMFKGSFWGQGRIDGALGEMLSELSTKRPVIRPKLYGR